jgi:hypothetical protein
MRIKDLFPAFTLLLNYCKPGDSMRLVYNVEETTPLEPNLIMHYAKFEEEKMVGESGVFIISKQWVLDNIDNIVNSLPIAECK